MSLLLAGLTPTTENLEAPDLLFRNKTFDDIGKDPELTAYMQRTLDPDGSKYGGDIQKLKDGFLNDTTKFKSGTIAPLLDWIGSSSETTSQKQAANLRERLYESAPNRLFSRDSTMSQRAQALGAGIVGGGFGQYGEELLLNLLLTPVTLGKIGITAFKGATMAGAAERALASPAARELVEKLSAGHVFADGEREALEGAVRKAAFSAGWRGNAAFEAASNAVIGGVGGAAEHYGQANRGIDNGSAFGDIVGGAAGGAVLGGVLGGAMAIPGAKRLGRELTGEVSPRELGADATIPAIAGREADARAAAEAERVAQERSAQAAQAPAVPDTSARDGALDIAVNLRELQSHVGQVATEAGVDRSASRFGRDTLALMGDTLARSSDIDALAASKRAEAEALTSVEAPKPEAAQQAGLLRRDAAVLDRFSRVISDPEQRAQMLDGDDVHPLLAQALAVIEPKLAPMMERDLAPNAAPAVAQAPNKSAAGQAEGAATQPQAASQGSTPQAQPQTPTQVAGAEAVAAAAPDASAVNASASELDQLRPRFSPEDTVAVSDADALLQSAGTDLNAALARISSEGGPAQVVADVAKAAGVTREEARSKIGKAAAAVTKARAARDAEGVAAPTPTAEQKPKVEPTKTEEGQKAPAPAEQKSEPPAPEKPADAPDTEQLAEEASVGSGLDYTAISSAASTFADNARAAINTLVLQNIDGINAGDKAALATVDQALDGLRQSGAFGTLFDGVTAERLATRSGKDKVEADIQRAAVESVSWHYATAISPFMRDPFSIDDFGKLLSLMPGVPEAARRRIAEDFANSSRKALAREVATLGSIDAVGRKYGDSAAALLRGDAAAVKRAAEKAQAIQMDAVVDEAAAGLTPEAHGKVAKAVRQFRAEIESLGMAADEGVLREALRARAFEAAAEERARAELAAIRKSVKDETAAANPAFVSQLADAERPGNFTIGVRRVASGAWEDFDVDSGSFLPNPIVQRITRDELGNRIPYSFATEGELVSGRTASKDITGNVNLGSSQGFLGASDEFGILGRLRASVRSASGARRVINENAKAFIDAAGKQKRDAAGKSTGTAGGKRAEKLAAELEGKSDRMLQMRMDRISDLVVQRETGELSDEAFQAAIAAESKFVMPVKDSEIALARLWYEARERVESARAIAQRAASDILEELEQGGVNLDQVTVELSKKLQQVMEQSRLTIQRFKPDAAPKTVERADAVPMKSRDGKTYEVLPARHIAVDKDGQLTFLGQVVGSAVEGSDGNWSVKLTGEAEPVKVRRLAQLAGRRDFKGAKVVRDTFEARKAELVKAAEEAADQPVIPEQFTRTAEVEEAKAEVTGAKTSVLSAEMRAAPVSSFDVPPGYMLVLRSSNGTDFIPVRPRHKTLGDAVKDAPAGAEWTLGLLPAKQNKDGGISYRIGSTERAIAGFVPYGRDPAAAGPDMSRVLKAMEAQKDVAPEIAKAQNGPISLRDAESVKMSDGGSLADAATSFVSDAIGLRLPSSLSDLDGQIAALAQRASELESMAPHGVLRPMASRRTSFSNLMTALASAPRAEAEAALDLLRRIDTGARGLPYVGRSGESALGGGTFRSGQPDVKGFNYIGITAGNGMPAHITVAHEVAHWAYANLLTPSEQVDFLRAMRKHYDGNGQLSFDSIESMIRSARSVETHRGFSIPDLNSVDVKANELFAWSFTDYFMQALRSGRFEPEEASLWSRVTHKVRAILEAFFGNAERIDPELRTLFERILPPSPRESQYRYDSMLDTKTGELVASASPVDSRHERALTRAGYAQRIDELRGKLDAHLFSLDGSPTGAFAEDLKAAALHMNGLLRSRDIGPVTERLRAALRTVTVSDRRDANGNRIIQRDANGAAIKDENGKNIALQDVRAVPGAIAFRKLFGRAGAVMDAVGESLPVVKSIDEARDGNASALEKLAPDLMQDGNHAEFMASYERKFEELVNTGKTADEADDMAWTYATEQHGAREGAGSQWEALTAGMGTDEKASAAMRVVALQLRDLMTDAIEHFESEVRHSGFQLQRNGLAVREAPEVALPADSVEAAKAVMDAAKASKEKAKPVAEPLPAGNDATAQAAAKETQDRLGDLESRGMPIAAPTQVAAVVSRVTHRDPIQKELIDGIGYDIFNLLEIEHPTNADIARLTGADLEEGLEPDAPAAASAAFDEFRKVLRGASEALTHEQGDPLKAARELSEMMARGRGFDEESATAPARVANAIVAKLKRVRNVESLPAAERKALEALDTDGDFRSMVEDIQADVTHILASRGKSRAAKAALPMAEQSPVAALVQPIPKTDGGLHPQTAQRTVDQTLSLLSDDAVEHIAERLGLFVDGGDARAAVRDSVLFFQPKKLTELGEPLVGRVELTAKPAATLGMDAANANQVLAGMDPKTIALLRELNDIDGVLARSDGSNQALADAAARRQHVVEALRKVDSNFAELSDAAVPVMLNADSIVNFDAADPLTLAAIVKRYTDFVADPDSRAAKRATDPQLLSRLDAAAKRGDGVAIIDEMERVLPASKVAALFDSLKLGGYRSRDSVTVFDGESLHSFDALVNDAARAGEDGNMPDAPLAGELMLHLAADPARKADSLGLQQRALQKGASGAVAKLVSRMVPGRSVPEGEEVYKAARSFSWPIQLRENASRIRQAGGNWLADLIKPAEGAGFTEALHSSLGRALQPMLDKLDAVSGRTNGLKRWASDLFRNGALHKEEIPQTDAEKRIALAIRGDRLHTLSEPERRAALAVQQWFADALERQRDAGIPVEDITGKTGINTYLPQRFNQLWIRGHADEAVTRLAKWFEKEGRDAADAKARAQKVISRVMDDDPEAQMLGGAADTIHRNAFDGNLYARILTISSSDMEKLGLSDLFDNNLRSLMIGYANNAETRIQATKRFGVKGHGLDTYLDIGQRGRQAAIDALLDSASGFSRDLGSVSTGDMTEQAVKFTSQIMSPLTSDPREAEALVNDMLAKMQDTTNIGTKQEALADALVQLYQQRGLPGDVHFAARARAIVGGLSDFGPNGSAVTPSDSAFMREFTSRLVGQGVRMSDAERRVQPAVKALMTFNSVSLLSMATVASLADPAMALIRSGNMAAWGKGMAVLAKQVLGMGPEGVQAVRNIGVSLDQAIHQGIQDMHGGRIGRFNNAFFLANGLTPWTNTMRNIAGIVGFESIRTAQAAAQAAKAAGNVDGREYMKAVRYLRQLGCADLVDAPALGSLADSQEIESLRQAIHRFTNESVFQPGRNDIPLQFQDNPFWKLMFQFKSYPMMLGRMVKRNVLEATATETNSQGKRVYVGDVKPLAFMLTVGTGLAAGAQAARDVVSGRNQEADPDDSSAWRSVRDRSWSRIAQEIGFMDKDEVMDNQTADHILGWYVEGLMGLGALGMVGDMFYQSAKAIDNGAFGRERIMSQLFGPTFGTFSSAFQAIEGAVDRNEDSNAKERIGARALATRIPVVASQQPWTEALTTWLAGPAATP